MPMPITSCQRATGSGEGSGKSRGQKFMTDRVGLALLLGQGSEHGEGELRESLRFNLIHLS